MSLSKRHSTARRRGSGACGGTSLRTPSTWATIVVRLVAAALAFGDVDVGARIGLPHQVGAALGHPAGGGEMAGAERQPRKLVARAAETR